MILSEFNCDCLEAQNQKSLCQHVHAFCCELKRDLELYISDIYSVDTYKEIYYKVMSSVVINLKTIEEVKKFAASINKLF